MRTEGEILQLIYNIVKVSDLYAYIHSKGGEVFKKQRPKMRAGKNMDIVVAVLAGTNSKIQRFTVNVNVYFPDINSGGEFFEDTNQSKQIQSICADLFEHYDHNEYFISYSQGAVPKTFALEDTHEHFVRNELSITIQNF